MKEAHNGKRRRHLARIQCYACCLGVHGSDPSDRIASIIRQSNGLAIQVPANATTQRLSVNIGAHHRTPQCLPPEQLRASLEPTVQTSASKSFLPPVHVCTILRDLFCRRPIWPEPPSCKPECYGSVGLHSISIPILNLC